MTSTTGKFFGKLQQATMPQQSGMIRNLKQIVFIKTPDRRW